MDDAQKNDLFYVCCLNIHGLYHKLYSSQANVLKLS